jgi:hypothetical protein
MVRVHPGISKGGLYHSHHQAQDGAGEDPAGHDAEAQPPTPDPNTDPTGHHVLCFLLYGVWVSGNEPRQRYVCFTFSSDILPSPPM